MAEFPRPAEGIVLTHFIVTSDVERSRRFYAGVLGGEVLLAGEPTIVALANGWRPGLAGAAGRAPGVAPRRLRPRPVTFGAPGEEGAGHKPGSFFTLEYAAPRPLFA
jgi:hypothetical protein